jgi:hypothetical protein
MRRSLLLRQLPSLLLGTCLVACAEPSTVVTASIQRADGTERPAAELVITLLPYDRDSVVAALSATGPARPDTAELMALLDSLRRTYRADGGRDAMTRLQGRIAPRIEALRAAQAAWRSQTFRAYDSATYALIRRIARDPFADTTDAAGIAVVTPPKGGRWWVTASLWDPSDPWSEWYWNLPLAGDTVRLTPATATHRNRF